MSAEITSDPARLPATEAPDVDTLLVPATREEADTARRHAAEIGDYVAAQRWLWHERTLASSTESPDQP